MVYVLKRNQPQVIKKILYRQKKKLETLRKRGKKTPLRLSQNASAFETKRKDVSFKTQVRFTSNASAFGLKRKGVFGKSSNAFKSLQKKPSHRRDGKAFLYFSRKIINYFFLWFA